uniref:Uncharacterized protein n=1 Tax=Strongyloides venezuelensis TaxID=75913 RepID=A0A0K0FST2_STRVS
MLYKVILILKINLTNFVIFLKINYDEFNDNEELPFFHHITNYVKLQIQTGLFFIEIMMDYFKKLECI